MTYTDLLYQTEAQTKLLKGATKLADAVRVTLGPKSQSVLIQKKWGSPLVCNDGVTVAKEVKLKDAVEDLGAQMLKEVAEKTGDEVGDGTSTATIIAHAILAEGIRNIVAGASAVDVKLGLEHGLEIAKAELKAISKQMTTNEERIQVATISAHNDPKIGKVVADAVAAVGSDGAVTVEEATGTETKLEVVEGMKFDRGYKSAYFMTDENKMEAILEKPRILLSDKKISDIRDLVPLLEKTLKQRKPLVIIADDVEGDALATLVVNKIKGLLSCVAVQAPGFGDRRKLMLEDIAILTGGKVVSQDLGSKLETVELSDLGEADKVIVSHDSCTIIGGKGTADSISGRAQQLKEKIKVEKSDYEREKLQERLAKLTGGVGVIRVGALTESELKSKKEAFDDSIHAVKAAAAEGIVPGGGVALVRCVPEIEKSAESFHGDVRTGLLILKHALEEPTRQIAKNSGVDDGVVINEIKKNVQNWGFDAAERRYGNLFEFGIIDSVKVLRVALQNAVSIAGLLLLTKATLVEIENETEKKSASESSSYQSFM